VVVYVVSVVVVALTGVVAAVWEVDAVTLAWVVGPENTTEVSVVEGVAVNLDVDALVRLLKGIEVLVAVRDVVAIVALSVVTEVPAREEVAVDIDVDALVRLVVTVETVSVGSIEGVTYGKSVKQLGMFPHCLTPTGVQGSVP
jgi:hypothetical protein